MKRNVIVLALGTLLFAVGLLPAHSQAVPQSMLASSGPLRLELLDGAGKLLLSQTFASVTMGLDLFRTGFYRQGFRVALPVLPGAAGFRIYRDDQLLYERAVKGPAPKLGEAAQLATVADGTRLGWSLATGQAGVTYRVRASVDGGQSWLVLAIDQAEPSVTLPRDLLRGGARATVEVQASDGVRTDTRTYTVSAR